MPKRKSPEYYFDLIGEKHGKLTIIEIVGRNDKDRMIAKCRCDCGNECIKEIHEVCADKVGSCGCSRQLYKGIKLRTKERLYGIWFGIRERCYNPKEPGYHNYGGRGITVCEEWKNDYSTFRTWALSNGYADDLTIDRINVNGNYEPSNCKWATWVEQCNNKRGNILITYNGETHTATEWSRIVGISPQTIIHRYRRGFHLDIVFSKKRLASRGSYEKREDDRNSDVTKTA